MEGENNNGSMSMSDQIVNTAADVSKIAMNTTKIAAKAASGNVAGAAATALTNSKILKSLLCLLLAFTLLVTSCLHAVPNMIWEAAEQTRDVIRDFNADIEDTEEAIAGSSYYIFYGSSDGHEGLTGILTAIPRTAETLLGIAKAGWEFFTSGEISDESKQSMSESTKALVEQLYGGDSGNEKYVNEAKAGTIEGLDGSAGMGLAMANKKAATRLRIQGRIKDIRESIEDDFDKQVEVYGKDENFCNITETSMTDQIVNLILALYLVQTNGDLDSVTLAEYDNWLGKSKQTWMDAGTIFGNDKYEEVPKLSEGESYEDDELPWLGIVHHWGGEFLPQDIYEEYDRIAKEAVKAESMLDYHYTSSDRYQTRQKVMFGKYNMRSEHELENTGYKYPEYCTDEAYNESYAQVWYNADADKYYDRGVLDILVYPSSRIQHEFKERIVTCEDGSTETITQFYAYYEIKSLEVGSDDEWSDESEQILQDVIRLTSGSLYAFEDEEDETNEVDDVSAEGETVIGPRAVLKPRTDNVSRNGAKFSDTPRLRGWQMEWLKEASEIADKMFGTSGSIVGGGGGDMVTVATGELGTHETGNNNVKYTQWYPMVGAPWCAMFISWCADQCGYLASGLIPKTAHSATFWNYVLSDSSKGSLYTPADVRSGSATPCAGDILIVSPANNMEAPNNTTRADDSGSGTRHVALVTGYDSSSGNVATIDGNCSDQVMENAYNISSGGSGRKIWGFVRPAYPAGSAAGVEISGGIAHNVSGLDMDTDGSSDPADQDDPYYQSQTSIQTVDGMNYDASKVNYVVVARGSTSLLGCLATIKDVSSGKIINCIAADSGPRSNDWNEVSVCAARSLGYTVSGLSGVDTSQQFIITYYPDCKLMLYGNAHGSIQSQIDAQAQKYAASKGNTGNSGYTPNFSASSDGKID